MINWRKMAEAEAALIAFTAYSKYNKVGGVDESDFIGIRFVCISADSVGIPLTEDFYISSEDSAGNLELVADTPEAALELWIAHKKELYA